MSNLVAFNDMQSMAKDVKGYEGLYSVMPDGRIWAYPKKSRLHGRWLKPSTMRHGYKYVCLFKDGKRKNVYIHRIVGEAFLQTFSGKTCINHIDGNKANNNFSNLEWCTPKENKIHAWSTGITKITQSQIEASRRNITAYNLAKMGAK